MVPIPESIYFPALEQCLVGEELLICWKTVWTVLSSSDESRRAHPKLESFLLDPYVLSLIARPFNPYSFTSTLSKTAFETKTAAINVTPTTKRGYDINEIKEDALWLSKEAEIDEISALRIVVLEYQSRASAQILCDFTDEEAVSLQEAAGNVNAEFSTAIPRAMLSTGKPAPFDSRDSRRVRTLQFYLQECRCLLKCAGYFLQVAFGKDDSEFIEGVMQLVLKIKGKRNGKSKRDEGLLEPRIGEALARTLEEAGTSAHKLLLDSIKSLNASFGKLQRGSGWFKEEAGREALEMDWLNNKLAESLHIMEIIFRLVDRPAHVPSADVALAWFRFASSHGFFDKLDTPLPSMRPVVQSIQSLSAIVSVTMLDLPRTAESLETQIFEEQDKERSEGPPLISDSKALNELYDIMLDAATAQTTLGGPAMLAWSLILRNMRHISQMRNEAREIRQSVYAIEGLREDSSLESDDASSIQTDERQHRRRSSVSSGSSSEALPYEEVLERIRLTSVDDDPLRILALTAIENCHVFDLLISLASWYGAATGSALLDLIPARARLTILSLTRYSIEVLDYASEVVSTVLAVLTGSQPFWKLLEDQISSSFFDVIGTFLNDEYLVQNLVNIAISRYPYESLPFLKLIHAIAGCRTSDIDGCPIAMQILERVPSFTFALSNQFVDYETIQEEDNANTIQLTRPIMLFKPRSNMLITNSRRGASGHSMVLTLASGDFTIPPGTQGRIVMESNPKVAIWFHEYSGLKYLGKLLETRLMAADDVDATTGEVIDRESIAEIIGLIATLLITSSKLDQRNETAGSHGGARHILEEASDGLGRSRDIVTVIFKLFEEELERQSIGSGQDSSTGILTASIQFIYALTSILPGRVWPLLGRGELLDIDGGGGRLSMILGRIELVTYRYDFLISCAYLFRALVEDCVKHAALRKRCSKTPVRSGSTDDLGIGVSEQILSKILFSFTRALADVYETACAWKFEVEEQFITLSELISTEFCNILYCTYGVDDTEGSQQNLTSSLIPSADHVIETFLSTTSGHLRFQPFLRALLDGFCTPVSTLQPPLLAPWLSYVKAGLRFAIILIRLGTLLERPTSQLENRLFNASPLIAQLYAVSESYQSPVIQLFEALVLSAASAAREPTSLLGYLGAQTSKNFIQMLLDLGKPLDGDGHVIEIWHLSSVIVSSRQQWFSIYLLTGRHPKQSLKGDGGQHSPVFAKTLLKTALQTLSDVQRLPGPKAVAMLEFVSLAQNFWPWAMGDLQKQSGFINSIIEYAVNQRFPVNVDRQEQVITGSYCMRIVAYIAEILAMYMYHLRQIGNVKPAEKLLQDIQNSFYLRSAVSPTSYNASLHGNLKRNFETRYKPCNLQNFKRTLLYPRKLGRSYFYDIQLADRMLHPDQAWVGRKRDGLSEDMALANVNLSLVDTEIALLHGYKLFVVELTTNLSGKAQLQVIAAGICKNLITSNMRSSLPDNNIFGRLSQTRAEFALILLQRLIELKCRQPEVLDLLNTVWDCIRASGYSFDVVLSSGGPTNENVESGEKLSGKITFDDATYYRTLLRLLFLALCAYACNGEPSVDGNAALDIESSSQGSTQAKARAKTQLIPAASSVSIILEIVDQVIAAGFRQLVVAIHDKSPQSVPDDIALVTALLQTCLRVPSIKFSHHAIMESLENYDTARVAVTLFSWSDRLAIDGDPVYGELSMHFLLELSCIPVMAEQLAVAGILGHISSASIASHIRLPNISPFTDSIGPQRCYSIWVRGILPLLLNILTAVGAPIAREVALFLLQFPHLMSQSARALDSPLSSFRASSALETASKTKSPLSASTRNSYAARITYSMVAEVHSLALLTHILSSFRDSMVGIDDIPAVPWDATGVLENAEQLLSTRLVLRQRIMPTGARELEWARQKPLRSRDGTGTGAGAVGGREESENRLEEKIVEELKGVRDVLGGSEE